MNQKEVMREWNVQNTLRDNQNSCFASIFCVVPKVLLNGSVCNPPLPKSLFFSIVSRVFLFCSVHLAKRVLELERANTSMRKELEREQERIRSLGDKVRNFVCCKQLHWVWRTNNQLHQARAWRCSHNPLASPWQDQWLPQHQVVPLFSAAFVVALHTVQPKRICSFRCALREGKKGTCSKT